MEIDFNAWEPSQRYALMIRAITPRPIAWVSTLSPQGVANLAPFSFFAGVGSDPPALVFSVVDKPDGSPKDTLVNIRETGEFVVNLVPFDLRQPMHQTAQAFDYEVSEFEQVGLAEAPSHTVRPSRVQASPIQFECRLHQIVSIGTAHSIFGIIHWVHVADSVLDENRKIAPDRLDTIGRMGGMGYTRTTERFELK